MARHAIFVNGPMDGQPMLLEERPPTISITVSKPRMKMIDANESPCSSMKITKAVYNRRLTDFGWRYVFSHYER